MFVVTVVFTLNPGQKDAFMPLMLENARLSLELEEACSRFDVCENGDDIFLYEIYDDAAAFDAHLKMAHFAAFSEAVEPMVEGKVVQTYALVSAAT